MIRSIFLLAALLVSSTAFADEIDFNRDIRPILTDKCAHCHGPDARKRKAGLRLDTREGATARHDWGSAIVPGRTGESELVKRITHPDVDQRMPPADSNLKLSVHEIELLKRWIDQGAAYDVHWAFKLPVRPELPTVKAEAWVRNPIDRFVLARLEAEGLAPRPEADRRTLLRRVSLDLTGLPPSPEEMRAFLADGSPNAYEKAVDRLLSSIHYGERMALVWMDAARYADTGGYQNDTPRTMWPWRDWVIRAYNRNLPFDAFTVEQLAGDLLENPTTEQRLATGFNRNHRINNEGGVLAEEFLVEYVCDRVETTSAVWLGLTMGCVRCHSHKYDPIEHDEYYKLYAYFNGVPEKGKAGGNAAPTLKVPRDMNGEGGRKLEAELAALEQELEKARGSLGPAQAAWEKGLQGQVRWRRLRPTEIRASSGAGFDLQEDGSVLATGKVPRGNERYDLSFRLELPRLTAVRLHALPDAGLPKEGPGRHRNGNFVLSSIGGSLVPPDVHQVRGRIVRVEIPGRNRYLSLAEVQVFDGATNVARKGKAKQINTGYGGAAGRAIDGKTNPVYAKGSITHTNASTNPWWEVDLGRVSNVSRIVIWNRGEDLHARLDGFKVSILDGDRREVWKATMKKATPQAMGFDVSGALGLDLAHAQASFEQENHPAVDALKGKDPRANGWAVAPRMGKAHTAVFALREPLEVPGGSSLALFLGHTYKGGGAALGRFAVEVTDDPGAIERTRLPADVAAALEVDPSKRTEAQEKEVALYFATIAPELRAQAKRIQAKQAALEAYRKKNAVTVMVMAQMEKPRPTYRLERGQYDKPDKSREIRGGIPRRCGPGRPTREGASTSPAGWSPRPTR